MHIQTGFFDNEAVDASIPGLVYQADFLSKAEELQIMEIVQSLPLQAAKYKQYEARRRVISFGGSFDFDSNTLLPTSALDTRLEPLRRRVAAWLELSPEKLIHALVSEYAPGTPLGWHRDVPDFEAICGVSLGGRGTLRFRPYPFEPHHAKETVKLCVQGRSIYKMEAEARWAWQHSVSPTPELRWSITFRTAARRKGQTY